MKKFTESYQTDKEAVDARTTRFNDLIALTNSLQPPNGETSEKVKKLFHDIKSSENSVTSALKNATLSSDKLDRWQDRIEAYQKAIGTLPPVQVNFADYLVIFQSYYDQHPNDADFSYNHAELQRALQDAEATEETKRKHFDALVNIVGACSKCGKPVYHDKTCYEHYFKTILTPRMTKLNKTHHKLPVKNVEADEILVRYIEFSKDYVTNLETLRELCSEYEASLKRLSEVPKEPEVPEVPEKPKESKKPKEPKKPKEEEEEEEQESSESDDDDSSSSLDPNVVVNDSEEHVDNAKRDREVSLVNMTIDYLLLNFDNQLPEQVKTVLKLLRDGGGSQEALLNLMSSGLECNYDIISTVISTGQAVWNGTFQTFEEAQEFMRRHRESEYINRSIVKRVKKNSD